MRHTFLLVICLFLSLSGYCGDTAHVQRVSKENLKNGILLDSAWHFRFGDDMAYASPEFDDGDWEIRTSVMNIRRSDTVQFNSIGWFRKSIYIDSNLNDVPLSIDMTHFGASEVYVDGRRVAVYGYIDGEDSTENAYPKMPTPLSISPGWHTVAVRYANYKARNNFERHHQRMAGFSLKVIKTAGVFDFVSNTLQGAIAVLTFFFTFLLAFFILHFILFLFNPREKANIYFSLFCLAFAALFLSVLLRVAIPEPVFTLITTESLIFCGTIMCFTVTLFLNELFGKSRVRIVIIAMLCLVSLLSWYGWHFSVSFGLTALLTCVHAIFLIMRAIIRKVKGAWIVGFGILVFAVSIFGLLAQSLYYDSDVYMDNNMSWLLILTIISVPVSMSVNLSRNYSSINKSLAWQLKQVETLSAKTLEQELEKQRLLESRQEELEREVALRTAEVVQQKEKSDELLRNILPEEVAEELKEKGASAARYFDHVSVLFTDFVDFTKAGERLTPQELVDELHQCFKAFDEIISKYRIEKIKTIGDAYLAVSGLPIPDKDHAVNITKAAIEIRGFIAERKKAFPERSFNIRIGIHSGSVVAGIVGVKKFAYDIWGDTVNTAARMEQSGEAGKINISQATYGLVKDRFECTFRGEIEAKGKGAMNMYFVEAEK